MSVKGTWDPSKWLVIPGLKESFDIMGKLCSKSHELTLYITFVSFVQTNAQIPYHTRCQAKIWLLIWGKKELQKWILVPEPG